MRRDRPGDLPEAAAKTSGLQLKPEICWRLDSASPRPVPGLLFSLLQAVDREGTLTAAARRCGTSYRSAWNLMQQWSDHLGSALIESRRGSGARLTAVGRKLLWADRHAREQSRSMLLGVAQHVAREMEGLVESGPGETIRVSASHCLSHEILRRLVCEMYPGGVAIHHGGSARCLGHLASGACDAAGFHLADGSLGTAFVRRYRQHFDPASCRLILAVKRRQGLIMKAGNPKGIRSIDDLVREDIRFVNRQSNSGTRILLDLLLSRQGIDSNGIRGFDNIEFTHSAVSALVAGGRADVTVGTEAAAVSFDLDFISLASESYYYAVRRKDWERPGVRMLRRILAGRAWKEEVSALDGYDISSCGATLEASELFGRG